MGNDRQEAWRALSPLLDEALELDAAARERWLVELATSLPTVERELRALLDEDEQLESGDFLSPGQYADVLGPVSSLAGQPVGAWVLVRPLGQGGMGTVWLARRNDGRFEGTAAVKLLNISLLGRGEARFRREGSLLARLSHPNIAHLLDAGITAGGQPYLVLEHVDGERIDRWCDARRLDLPARLRLFAQVLDAVGHAHASLVVHRDLKPANILVTGDGSVKLLDFGIAALLDVEADGASAGSTLEGARALTPEFAAPEQARGAPITTATDVYALGVLLYVLLAGRHPTAEGRHTPADVLRALSEVEPARLGLGDLDTVLAKALRKAPAERYQTVAAFSDDVSRYLRHEPVSARGDSLAYRARKFVRRHRAAVAAGTLVAATLLGATAFSVVQMREARRQRDAALFAKQRADAQVEFQHLLMSEVGDRPVTMREILDKGRGVLEQQYAGDARFLATILVQLSMAYSDLGDTKVPRRLLARAESIAVAVRDRAQLAEVRCNVANQLRIEGRPDDARRAFIGADSILRAHPDLGSERACLELRAFFEHEMGKEDAAGTAIRRAIALMDSLGETRGMAYIEALGTLARVLDSEGRFRDALSVHQRVTALFDSSGRGSIVSAAINRHNMALTLNKLGETAETERVLHEVVERMARSDPTGRIPPQPLIHYAQVAFVQSRYDSARKYFDMLATQAVGDGNGYWEARASFGLAQAQIRLGALDDARRTVARFRRARATVPNPRTDDHILDARVLDGQLALATGDTAAAHARFVEALRANGYVDGNSTRHHHSALILAAETALNLRQPTVALRFAVDARRTATFDSLTETRSAYVGEARLLEGRGLLATGDTSGARAALGRAVVALRAGAGAGHPRTRETERLLSLLPR